MRLEESSRTVYKRGLPNIPLLPLLLLGFLALSTALNIANPIWEAIDETAHFQHVKFVAEKHRLPTSEADLSSLPVSDETTCGQVKCMARGTTAADPPLYYLLVAPFVMPIDLGSNLSWVPNPYFTWAGHPLRNGVASHTLAEAWPYRGMVLGVHVMRAVSALMVAGAIAAVYFIALAVRPKRSFALLAAGAAAVTPGVLLTSASVNNDNAAILTSSLALLAAVKAVTNKKRRGLWLVLFGLTTLLAVASKKNDYFLIGSMVVLAMLLVRQRRGAVPLVLLGFLGSAGVSLLALQAIGFNIRGALQYVPAALRADWYCPACTMFLQHYWGALPNLWETYWGSYGWETFHPPAPFYRPLLAVTLLAVVGLIWGGHRAVRGGVFADRLRNEAAAGVVLLAASLLSLLAIVQYRYLASGSDGGTTHARFLFPAIAASSILLALGLDSLRPSWLSKLGFGLLFASCLSVVGYSIMTLPKSFGPTLPVYSDAKTAGAETVTRVEFVNGMLLLGWRVVDESPLKPGQPLRVELFWGSVKPIDFDYSAFVRLNDGHGGLVHDSDHVPGVEIGLLSHEWLVGEVIKDDWIVPIPLATPAGAYRIEVGVYDYRDMTTIVSQGFRPTIDLGEVTVAG